MSTALVSAAFHDFGDVLYKPSLQTHRATDLRRQMSFALERRLSHVGNNTTASIINIPGARRVSAAGSLGTLPSPPPPSSPPHQHHLPLTTSNSITICNATPTSSLGTREHRKLDRSISEPVERSQQQQQQPRPAQPNSSRYKTELCRPFEENGTCKYGDKCQFAHGAHELRTLARHPKYKTELCRTFHSTGFCPYGPRCHFIHNSEETKKCLFNTLQAGLQVTTSATPQVASVPPRPKDLNLGSFSLGSAGDLSPSSSHSASPTSLNGFFLEDTFPSFSPVPRMPQTAPPTTAPFFFAQDYAPLKPVPALPSQQVPIHHHHQQQQQQQHVFVPEPGPPSPVETLNSDMDRLSLGGSPGPATPSTCTSPLDVSRNLPRLPIFSRLALGDSD